MELWTFSAALGGDAAELRGMSVEALDGGIGKVEDVVNEAGRAYLLVDTGPWIFGKTVKLPAGVVSAIDSDERAVFIDRTKDDVKNAPEYDPAAPADPAHDEALSSHYARREHETSAADMAEGTSATGAGENDDIGQRPAADSTLEPAGSGFGATSEAEPPAAWAESPTTEADASSPSEGNAETALSAPMAAEPPEPSSTDSSETVGAAATDSREDVEHQRRAAAQTEQYDAGPRSQRSGADTSASSKPSKSERPGGKRTARASSAGVPIARYDALTVAEVVSRLRGLSQRELTTVERYEKRHQNRQTVLSRVASLREKEPWRGYDEATVDEIRKKLADADAERLKAVRDYERRHRDRKGVMEVARRTLAAA